MRTLLLLLLFLFSSTLYAQQGWTDFVDYYLSQHAEEDEQTTIALLSDLEELHRSPLNINIATREQLLSLPLINDVVVDSILAQRTRRREFLDLGELLFIDKLSYEARCFLPLFLTCEPVPKRTPSFRELLLKGKNKLETRVNIPLYQRLGATEATDIEHRYLGSALYHTLRFRHEYTDRLYYGITLEKDTYEPFAKAVTTPSGVRYNLPYDFFSFHVAYRSRQGHQFIAGDYQVHSGQGLLLGSVAFGPKIQRLLQHTTSTLLRPYRSNNESNYYRGIAMRFRLPSHSSQEELSLLTFVSWQLLDAHLRGDTVRTFYQTGLHRNIVELTHRNTTSVLNFGTNLSWEKGYTHLGLTAYYAHYSHTISPPIRPYNRYALRGKTAGGFSLDATYRFASRWLWSGEMAFDFHLNYALSHALRYTTSNSSDAFRLFIQHRSISPRFVAPFAHIQMQHSKVANEHALLLGTTFTPLRHCTFTSYLEAFYHPEALFRALPKSKGIETFVEMRWQRKRYHYWLLSYKMKTKEETLKGKQRMEFRTTHRFAVQYFLTHKKFSFVPTVRAVLFHSQTKSPTLGVLGSVRGSYSPSSDWHIATFCAFFSSDDSHTRLYGYEPQLLGMMSFPSYGNKGCRFVMQGQWQCVRGLHFAVRLGALHLFNRSTIGSGLQTIRSSWQNDLTCQLLWKF